jgi:GNAT superfamily N-acetyltransferase
MRFREATTADIPYMHKVRTSVTENVLSHPDKITVADYDAFLSEKGKGWVCETGDIITGFSIVDLQGKNVWALFVMPGNERQGIGKHLHDIMLTWYFNNTKETIWLGTSPGTRAEHFYREAGWKAVGNSGNDELRFEMDYETWKAGLR